VTGSGAARAPAPLHALVRADASARIGHGHVMRCLALAQALRARGVQVSFAQREQVGHAGPAIEAAGFIWRGWPARDDDLLDPIHQTEDANRSREAWRAMHGAVQPDLLVLDHYRLGALWVQAFCRPSDGAAPTVLAIDDLADRELQGDLLLDPNWHDDPAVRYHGLWPAGSATAFGPAHALLRGEFARARMHTVERGKPPLGVVLAFGGSDPANATGACLDRLHTGLPGVALDVIVGAGSPQAPGLVERWASVPGVAVTVGASDVAARFARADVFVGAGGSMTWERACLGLAGVTLPIADNQQPLCRRLAEAGEGIDLGGCGPAALEQLVPAVQSLLHDAQRRQRMGQALAQRCDGLGAERVADRLLLLHQQRVGTGSTQADRS
jgi:UDP-2,4-diacetamido-2,4,6-trideoxy-beta-L-altropyranose hydrolase